MEEMDTVGAQPQRRRTLFPRRRPVDPVGASARADFAYLSADDVYLDSACQSLRPQPVINAFEDYVLHYNACGGRVKYAWGKRVDDAVVATREKAIRLLGLSPRRYACAFTLNTTYGLNLLLSQLPTGRFARVVTTHTEHNSVFLSTMSFASRTGVARVVAERGPDGAVLADEATLTDALVVVSAMNNVDGTVTPGLDELVATVHRLGGAVIVDAAQAAPHALGRLQGVPADAFCFSGHKMYAPSLGVVVATRDLLESLELSFIGGGQVHAVREQEYELLPEPETRLEPGLQAWGEIIAFGAALDWFGNRRAKIEQTEKRLALRLYDGLAQLPNLRVLSPAASPVISVVPQRVDGHRLATFLSKGGIMVRSGYFCAHHWLIEQRGLDPLVRFSLGAHNDDGDIDRALETMSRMMRGL